MGNVFDLGHSLEPDNLQENSSHERPYVRVIKARNDPATHPVVYTFQQVVGHYTEVALCLGLMVVDT